MFDKLEDLLHHYEELMNTLSGTHLPTLPAAPCCG